MNRSKIALIWLLLASPLAADNLPLTFADDLGDTVTLGAYPQRIVSLAPSNTEILYALGLADRVVGVTEFCDYPPETEGKPRVGGFANPNLEQIVALRPDLVLAARFNPLEVVESLRRLGIPAFALAPNGLEEALRSIERVGRLTGRGEEAGRLVSALRARVRAVEETVADIPEGDRPRVLWGRLEAPIYSAGPGSFIHDLIRAAGGVNIAAGAGAAWPQLGLEAIVAGNPQVIIVSGHQTLEKDLAQLKHTPGWQAVDAIRRGRVYDISLNLLGRPGPRLVDGLEALARAIHPERFSR